MTETRGQHTRVRPWVPKLARLMDSAFRLPGTGIRFGLDPIIGLIPGAR